MTGHHQEILKSRPTDVIFLDFSKVLDSVAHENAVAQTKMSRDRQLITALV